jgi:hypothetical protein
MKTLAFDNFGDVLILRCKKKIHCEVPPNFETNGFDAQFLASLSSETRLGVIWRRVNQQGRTAWVAKSQVFA